MKTIPLILGLVLGVTVTTPATAQKTLVAVFAHPDDERIVAPILARYAREGHHVHLVVATDGGKGVTPHAGIPAGDSLIAIRNEETRCAARELKIKPPILLGHPDAGLASFTALGKLRADLERVISELRPDALLTFGPEGGTGHPDHRLVGDMVTEIVQAAAADIPLYYPGLPVERMVDAPAARPAVRLVAERHLNVRVSYTPEDFAAAERSYICHASQYTATQAAANMRYVQHGYRGQVHLRAWNGGAPSTELFQQQPTPVATVTGLSGPEAVRYDPDQDIYFVSNFNGRGDAVDNNGFISRVRPDGTLENLHFIMGGTNGVTLHAPRGLYIVGDTLWVADIGAVRGFHRRTGALVANVDFAALQPGFLNDVAASADGVLYVTDTARNRIYSITGRTPRLALEDTALNRPNGITWDAQQNRLVVVPHGGKQQYFSWRAGQRAPEVMATPPGGRFDGVEVLSGGRILVSSQADSSVYALARGQSQRVTRTTGTPADIGVDTRRKRVAVPYISLNRVDIFQLPADW